MSTNEVELVKFEKWVEQQLGDEAIKKIRSNPYINYGSMKQLWDFMFENLYCPKFAKLVRMNLSLDNIKHEDIELTELKSQEIELDKKLNELKLESQKQDDEINSIVQSINETENSALTEENDNKTIDLLLQEIYLKQAEKIVKNFDDAIKKLTFKNGNEESNINYELKKQNVEKILCQYQNQLKTKLNIQNETNKASNIKLNQLSLREMINVLTIMGVDEIKKLNETMSESNIEKEIELLKYRIESMKLIGDASNSNLTLNDALNLQNLDFIEKNCEIISMKQEKQAIEKKIYEMKSKISVLFKNKDENMQIFKIYLKTLLEYKRAETNFTELEKFYSEIETETKNNELQSNLTIEKLNEIKKLIETINKNKKQIEYLIDLNSILINKPVDLQNQIEETIENLPEQMRSLNLNQSSLSFTFNTSAASMSSTSLLPILDDYFINDYEQFKSKLKPNEIQMFNLNDPHPKDILPITEYLNYPDYKSKHCLLDELIKIVNFIEKYNSTEKIDTSQTLNDLVCEENYLEKSKEEDRQNIPKYTNMINERIDTCIKWKNAKHEKEKIIEEWWSQPAAFECTFNHCTVDGKTIDYYYNIIDETIAKHANKL